MKLNKCLTPYPVLMEGDDDYVDSFFEAKVEQILEFGKIKVNAQYFLKNDGLQGLIDEGKANFALHIECPLLCYRKICLSQKKKVEYYIDLNEVAGNIEVSTFIVANENLHKYYNEKFNWEYGKEGVDISKGNILAIGPTYKIDIDRDENALKKISDIICIKEYETNDKKEMQVELEGPVIYIYVNKEVKNQYFLLGKKYFYTMISMIMVPAMMYVLTAMSNDEGGLCDYRWYGMIENLLKQNDVEVGELELYESSGKKSIFELAQKIFKSPLEEALQEFCMEGEE